MSFNINKIIINDGTTIEKSKNQFFQETKGRIELWELINKLPYLIQRWNKVSILWIFEDSCSVK